MHGSIFVVLTTLELLGAADPQQAKDGKPAPNLRKVEPEMGDISGYYTCKGEEANGKKYTGVTVLTKRGEVYVVSWVVGGGSTFTGIGIRQGNSLAASWSIATDKGLVRGINVYRIEVGQNGPRLVGRWASLPGPGVQQSETLTFLKKLESEDD